MRTLAALLLVLALAGCSTTSARRDLDVTGSLPQAIGLGAFAPSCVFFCFVSAHFEQAHAVTEEPGHTSLTVHGVNERTHKGPTP